MKKKLSCFVVCLLLVSVVCFGEARFLKTQEVAVDTTTAVKISDVSVSGLNIYSATIDFKVSFDGINYITLPANAALNLENLRMEKCDIYLKGATTSGNVIVVIMKY